jgi:hypothetical protein
MDTNDANNAPQPAAVGTLSDARSACAELIFARALIEAQTAKIEQLGLAAQGS